MLTLKIAGSGSFGNEARKEVERAILDALHKEGVRDVKVGLDKNDLATIEFHEEDREKAEAALAKLKT